ncbi:MAG: MATE family efflux transporter [Lachnospiraceae bacterium]|nr:MATE family efflux transporter [Lachnospiraceae bacterium]
MVEKSFRKEVFQIALPVALQSMLQSSFSMIDQIMVGQLGEKSIAAVEIAGKPSFIYTVVLGAIAAIAGIMISQYIGKEEEVSEQRSICVNVCITLVVGTVFLVLAVCFAAPFIRMFTEDREVAGDGTAYLKIIGWAFIPMGLSQLLSVPIRCRGKSSWPLYVGILSAVINTLLNYILIFGRLGFAPMGVRGAAFASVFSQLVSAAILLYLFFKLYGSFPLSLALGRDGYIQYLSMLLPVMINEFLWAVGQSINTFVYGHMGTEELAGMALTGSVQGLTIGALSGLSQAAGIMIGKRLGEREYERAYEESKSFCIYGLMGALLLAALLIVLRYPYVNIYRVPEQVKSIGRDILLAFAVLMPVKVENMILGGGIIRSGGRTKYIMFIDMLGTWVIGVPLALVCGLVLRLPIVWVYFILSQEELIRFLISVVMFKSRKWMNTIR